MTKGRLLTLWLAIAILGYIFASQDWYTLSMSPNGDSVKLATYDGLTAYPNLSPILMLNFAAVLTVAFVGSLGRKITTIMLASANVATIIWMTSRISAKDISGLAKQVEQMTGIAAAHGVKDLTVDAQIAPTLFLAAMAALIGMSALVLAMERKWPKRQSRTERTSTSSKVSEPKDAIGIWDSQRR